MNVNEWGVKFLFSTGYDMSAQTSLTINFVKPNGATLTKTATVGAGNIATTAGLFIDKQYAQYTFINGDVDQAGDWTARVVYTDASPKHLISDLAHFTIYT